MFVCVFLKVHQRTKDGKDHRYYSLVESVRTSRGPQHRTLAYLGELNGSTESAWRKSIAVFNREGTQSQLELFPSDAPVVPSGEHVVQVIVLDRDPRRLPARRVGETRVLLTLLDSEVVHCAPRRGTWVPRICP